MAREHGAKEKVDRESRGETKSGEARRGRGHSRPQSHSSLLARGGLGPYQASSAKTAKRTNGSGYENRKRREKNSPRTSSPHSSLEIKAHGTI